MGEQVRAEDAIRLGWAAGAKVALRNDWLWEIEDVKQDGAMGAFVAFCAAPHASVAYICGAARNYVYARRTRRYRRDGRLGFGLSDTTDPWAQCEAALDVGTLADPLTERLQRALVEEGEGRGDDAHYKARSRAIRQMRELAW